MINTKNLIKNAAIDLLFKQGKFNTNSEALAKYIGIKRPLIYYYFEDYESLINEIIYDTKSKRDHLFYEIIFSQIDFKKKLDNLITMHLELSFQYPFRQIYIFTNKLTVSNFNKTNSLEFETIQKFKELIDNEIKNGALNYLDSNLFIIDFFSLINYPLLISPIAPNLLNISLEKYQNIIQSRKNHILNFLLK